MERLIGQLQPLLHADEPTVFEIDLGGLVHLSPAGLALLCATLRRLDDEGLVEEGSTVFPPRSPLTHAYLLRMDVIRHVIGGPVEEFFERRDPAGFRPCEHFVDAPGAYEVARDMTDALAERCEVDRVAQGAIRVCLDELCENVIHHADTPTGGFAAAQGWPRKRMEFEVAIVDLGVGIRSSLTKNPQYADLNDDVTAIERALEPRVTATPARNAGLGLAITRMLLRANGGHLVVRSGFGRVYSGNEDARGALDHHLPGTLVALTARIDRPLDIGSVYRSLGYTDADA